MGWRMIRQPNGKLARFSDVVDDFTDYDLTANEAFDLCRDIGGVDVARRQVASADEHPERFEESIETVKLIHGSRKSKTRRQQLST